MSREDVGALEQALIAQIRAEIAASTMTQGQVAKAVGIEPATMSRYLQGRRPLPLQVLLDVSDTLGIQAADLLRMAEERARRDAERAGDS